MDLGVLLIVTGVAGMFVSALADLMGVGRPGFGTWQLSGLVISALVAAAGLAKVLFADTRMLVRTLAGVYVGGVFYAGLKSFPLKANQNKMLLSVRDFQWYDFFINTAGFVFLGYLCMLGFGNKRKDQTDRSVAKKAIFVVGIGGLISLFLEASQYYFIPGRSSSLFDLMANTLGCLVGISIYLLLERYFSPPFRLEKREA